MSRRFHRGIVSPVNLRDVYAQMGEYTAKFIIEPRDSSKIDHLEVAMFNSDGVPMNYSFKRWGTKLNIAFSIDSQTPDGISIIDVAMRGRDIGEVRERFDLWVIK